jgi:hypothetical protein
MKEEKSFNMTREKKKLLLDWFSAVVFLMLTSLKVADYIATKENWSLFGSIVFGLLTVIKLTDLVIFYRKKKREGAGHRI